ncbi:baseplate J/gp47 family protein [Paraglaciecola sp. L1A13]|uniref:baseplate J/gp47 family protein n=1 Tax=Paraglaciecola sp. L1A13 TaxID=2686359 RepID=UPI00131BD78A|nr:baseplate J/gp47 family protein [Paraglaciecola sp. L1A13]
MSYVAEPYAQFVDDLLTGFTGGHVRETFRMLEEQRPFRLSTDGAALPNTIRVFGQKEGAINKFEFFLFRLNTDYQLLDGTDIKWLSKSDGSPAIDAIWPADGTTFYVNYESTGGSQIAPLLTDRSPGSVTRLLAESVGREYAVLSGQLEKVYEAAFLSTAAGRDLENVVALIGLERYGRNVGEGMVSFSRTTPSPADITIASGKRLSTADAPAVAFETTRTVTLQRGQLSVDSPVQALTPDSKGIVAANTIVVINRPILGIDSVSNPEATKFAGQNESDDALRLRAKRALESAGQATVGALQGVLTGLHGLREKDMRFTEDPIEHPGIVNLEIALPELSPLQTEDYKRRAMALLEETRPVGIRIRHNIEAFQPPGPAQPSTGQDSPIDGAPIVSADGVGEKLHMPVDFNVTLQPTTLTLTPEEQEKLIGMGISTVNDFIAEAGLGETLVYNQLIAALMNIDGVLDVTLEMFPTCKPEASRTRNVMPNQLGARPIAGVVDVQIGNSLVALDITVAVTFNGAGEIGNVESNANAAANDIRSDLQQALNSFTASQIDPAILLGLIPGSDSYAPDEVHYRVEFMGDGIRINQSDIVIPSTGLERFWIRSATVLDQSGTVLGSSV